MIKFQQNVSLKKYNSFKVNSTARYFFELKNKCDLFKIFSSYRDKFLVIGEGNNILLTKNLNYLVIKNSIKGIDIIEENSNYIKIKINSGENFSNIVRYFSNLNYSGIENLIDIPGNLGGVIVQNIGAYGSEIKDVVSSVEVFDIEDKVFRILKDKDLDFSYRSSIFKKNKNKYIIISAIIKLIKDSNSFKISYKGIKEELGNKKINSSSIASAISRIRARKLPNPDILPNSGSFFKNPIIFAQKYNSLNEQYNDIPSYFINSNRVKIPAAWLIEKAGFKNYRYKNVGVYKEHTLILVNYSSTDGKDLKILSEIIKKEVKNKFDIELEEEVIVI